MDFIEWCNVVLEKISEAIRAKSPQTVVDATHEGKIAETLFGEFFIAGTEFWESERPKALKQALKELKAAGLIEEPPAMSSLFAISPSGKEYLSDRGSFIEHVSQIEIPDEQVRLLAAVNRLSNHPAEDHAWIEKVPQAPLLSTLGWNIQQLWEASKPLHEIEFVYRQAGLGHVVNLCATFKGMIWADAHGYKVDSTPSEITGVEIDENPDLHLSRLLKLYRAAGGSQRKRVNLADAFKDEGLSQADIDSEAEYMEGEGWIKATSDEAIDFYITHAGIKLAQSNNAPTPQPVSNMTTPIDTRNVFVVHGRNLEARNSLFRFLRSIRLSPLEWSQAIMATGKASPFIGEILDAAFAKAQAVVVLMTPDDEARLLEPYRSQSDPPYESQLTGQARPNVLFEAGMAMGRNPDRTIIVELGIVRPFSDIAGRHTVKLSNDSTARHELAQRLETAGCSVDLSGRDWHTEGDFSLPVADINHLSVNIVEDFGDKSAVSARQRIRTIIAQEIAYNVKRLSEVYHSVKDEQIKDKETFKQHDDGTWSTEGYPMQALADFHPSVLSHKAWESQMHLAPTALTQEEAESIFSFYGVLNGITGEQEKFLRSMSSNSPHATSVAHDFLGNVMNRIESVLSDYPKLT
jgi:predicted nucleotide-binding protein